MAKSAMQIVREASELATKIKADNPINMELKADSERTIESKLVVIKLKDGLVATYGDALDDMPEPDSGPEGNNPDKFEETIPNSKRVRKSSFWKETALRVPFVMAQTTALEQVKNQLSKEPAKDNPFRDRTNAWLDAEKKAASARVTAAVNRFTNAVRLYWQEGRVMEYPNVELEYSKDENGEAERRSNPIIIHRLIADGEKKGQRSGIMRYFTVGEFLQLDVAHAEENGSTFDALVSSGKREDPDKQTKLAEAVKTPDTFDDYVTSLWHFLQDSKNVDRLASYLRNPDNASFCKAIYDVELKLDAVLHIPGVKKAVAKAIGDEEEEGERETKVA